MMNIRHFIGLSALLLLANSNALYAAVDINNGKNMFNQECAECHSVKEGKNKKGPSLWNVLGRKSASISDFNYSDNMRSSQIVWTTDQISAYMEHPKKVVPAGKMKYDGLDNPKDRADLIEFLSSLH